MLRLKLCSLLFITTIFHSCEPCLTVDCLSDNLDGQFRIVSAADGRDLVFGSTKIYDSRQIKFYSLKGTDSTFFNSIASRNTGVGYDSILQVRFYPRVDTAFMFLGNGDVDTLKISYDPTNMKCCGNVFRISNFRINNAVDIPGGKGVQEIKK